MTTRKASSFWKPSSSPEEKGKMVFNYMDCYGFGPHRRSSMVQALRDELGITYQSRNDSRIDSGSQCGLLHFLLGLTKDHPIETSDSENEKWHVLTKPRSGRYGLYRRFTPSPPSSLPLSIIQQEDDVEQRGETPSSVTTTTSSSLSGLAKNSSSTSSSLRGSSGVVATGRKNRGGPLVVTEDDIKYLNDYSYCPTRFVAFKSLLESDPDHKYSHLYIHYGKDEGPVIREGDLGRINVDAGVGPDPGDEEWVPEAYALVLFPEQGRGVGATEVESSSLSSLSSKSVVTTSTTTRDKPPLTNKIAVLYQFCVTSSRTTEKREATEQRLWNAIVKDAKRRGVQWMVLGNGVRTSSASYYGTSWKDEAFWREQGFLPANSKLTEEIVTAVGNSRILTETLQSNGLLETPDNAAKEVIRLLIRPDDKEQLLVKNLQSTRKPLVQQAETKKAYHDPGVEWPRYKWTARPVHSALAGWQEFEHFFSPDHFYLPVVRYPGLYYSGSSSSSSKEPQYCGTFYFVEVNSDVLLDLGERCIIVGSKMHALRVLLDALEKKISFLSSLEESKPEAKEEKRLVESGRGDSSNVPDSSPEAILFKEGEEAWRRYRGDMVRGKVVDTWAKIPVDYWSSIVAEEADLVEYPTLGHTVAYPCIVKFPTPELEEAYWKFLSTPKKERKRRDFDEWTAPLRAKGATDRVPWLKAGDFDALDQIICKLARLFRIDTIILQHEIGEERTATEILDARPDSKTSNHLYYIDTTTTEGSDLSEWWKPRIQSCPTLWFLNDGLIRNGRITHDFFIDRADMNLVKPTPPRRLSPSPPPVLNKEEKKLLFQTLPTSLLLEEEVATPTLSSVAQDDGGGDFDEGEHDDSVTTTISNYSSGGGGGGLTGGKRRTRPTTTMNTSSTSTRATKRHRKQYTTTATASPLAR